MEIQKNGHEEYCITNNLTNILTEVGERVIYTFDKTELLDDVNMASPEYP